MFNILYYLIFVFNSCFISDYRVRIALFLVPIYSIIFFNICAFFLVIKVVIFQRQKRHAKKSKERQHATTHLKTLASIISIMVVYGFSWFSGLIIVDKAQEYTQWPFLILNVFQGVLIFLLIGVFNTYKEWKSLVGVKKKVLKTVSTSNADSIKKHYF